MDNDSLAVNIAQADNSISAGTPEVQMSTAERLDIFISVGAKDPSGALFDICGRVFVN
ncbi:MAG: hypothetical protein MJY78_08425 [Fibrobacter sp.]|nr:hypothetical protein [Fibrobacter sp.]